MDGVEIFTATKAREREGLGARATEWVRSNSHRKIKDVQVTQSSDDEFHCLTICILFSEPE